MRLQYYFVGTAFLAVVHGRCVPPARSSLSSAGDVSVSATVTTTAPTVTGETGSATLTATYDDEFLPSATSTGEAPSTVSEDSEPPSPTDASSAVDPVEEDFTTIPESTTVSPIEATTPAEPSPTTATDENSSSSQPSSTSEDNETTAAPDSTAVPDDEWTATSESSLEASTSTTQGEQAASPTAEPSAKYPTFPRQYPADKLDELRDRSIPKLVAYLAKKSSHSKRQQNACTLENARVRREWGDLSLSERTEYIAAVKCLMQRPPQWPAAEVPGARSRFDDFVAAHIFNSSSSHGYAHALFWHRYYLHAYETALRDECGYTGAQPYWNTDRWAEDPKSSPLFDGSATSFGGDGNVSWPNGAYRIMGGPFADLKVNLGPGYAFDYNPRFVRRYISHYRAHFTTTNYTYPLIMEHDNLEDFQNTLQRDGGSVWWMSMATIYSYYSEIDVPSWVADPVSFLFFASMDRLWWLWQLQDLDHRLYVIAGMHPNSWQLEYGRLNDTLNLGYVGGEREVRELVDTMDGPFCYIYY